MKGKLQEYALIAEIIGGIAIVVSLIFLTLELRESNLQATANADIQISELISDWALNLSVNPEVSRIFFTGLEDFSSLSPTEKSQFQYLMISFYSAYTGAVSARDNVLRSGIRIIDESSFGGMEAGIFNIVSKPGFRQWWDSEYYQIPPAGISPYILFYMDYEQPPD